MALDFPSSPTNNQVYENYIYSASSGAWQKLPGNTFATTAISDTPPVNPANGDLWWNSADGKFYIYYSDGSSSQWVSAALPAVAVSDTPPAGYDGQMWLDSTDGSMYVYYTDPGGANSQWIGAVSRSGGILQVVQTAKTDSFTTTSTAAYVAVTGLTASITPRSTSSKVLVRVAFNASQSAGTFSTRVNLTRNGSPIARGTGGAFSNTTGNVYTAVAAAGENFVIEFLDSPSTTSSTAYGIEVVNNAAGTFYVNSFSTFDARGVATITLTEVAG